MGDGILGGEYGEGDDMNDNNGGNSDNNEIGGDGGFYGRMLRLNEEVEMGLRNAEFNLKLVREWSKRREKSPIDFRNDTEGRTLLGRFKESIEHLDRINVKYKQLCKDVNTYYGREVLRDDMLPSPGYSFEDVMREIGGGDGDWWRV